MRRYELVSGLFFFLMALVQLTRVLLAWPVQVAGVQVPIWASAIAFCITSIFAIWALRTIAHRPPLRPE